MIIFHVRETYLGHVVHAGGFPEIKIKTINDVKDLEDYLTYADQENGSRPDYLMRELLGVEVIQHRAQAKEV